MGHNTDDMKNKSIKKYLIGVCVVFIINSSPICIQAQNVGVGLLDPESKLHIQGSADNSQFIIDANSTQSNTSPLIKLRKSDGTDLLWIHSDYNTNVFVGLNAGRVNAQNEGDSNSFIGSNAGYSNTIGDDNTVVGSKALYFNTTGNLNTASGSTALYKNTIGNLNVAFGAGAMYWNTKGCNNAAFGSFSLDRNTTASNNIAIGTNALYEQSYSNNNTLWISGNIAIGYEALYNNEPTSISNGIYNLAIGSRAMYTNTTGFDNVAIGESVLYANTDGFHNTAIGKQSLENNIGGDDNVALGWKSLPANTSGSKNTGIGVGSLTSNTSGLGNTAVGYNSLISNNTGQLNCAFGQAAYFTSSALNNTTCIGYLSGGFSNVDNRIEIGNSSVSWIGGQVNWAVYSDGRIKNNVREDVPGLDFINRLRPVTYNLNIHSQNNMAFQGKKEEEVWDSKYDIEEMRMTGFIAQEVEQAAKEVAYNFSGIQKPPKENELYSIRYAEFVMPLVKAVQELSQENQVLKNEMNAQNEVLIELKNKLATQEAQMISITQKFEAISLKVE